MKLCTAVQEGCGYKDTPGAHRYFAPSAKTFHCVHYSSAARSSYLCRPTSTEDLTALFNGIPEDGRKSRNNVAEVKQYQYVFL